MLTETTRTCSTCPLAQKIDRDRYVCTATHNHHSTQVVRGHWEATADCETALPQTTEATETEELTSPGYVMELEANLEKAATRTTQQEEYSKVAMIAPRGIEVDSIKQDSYRIWSGTSLIGTMRRTSAGWMARPAGGGKSWHSSPDDAQDVVIAAAIAQSLY